MTIGEARSRALPCDVGQTAPRIAPNPKGRAELILVSMSFSKEVSGSAKNVSDTFH
jgi:hypothetical protein